MKSKVVKWIATPLGLVFLIVGVVTLIWPPGTVDLVKLGLTVGLTISITITLTVGYVIAIGLI